MSHLFFLVWFLYKSFPRANVQKFGEHPMIAAQPYDASCPVSVKVVPNKGKVRSCKTISSQICFTFSLM